MHLLLQERCLRKLISLWWNRTPMLGIYDPYAYLFQEVMQKSSSLETEGWFTFLAKWCWFDLWFCGRLYMQVLSPSQSQLLRTCFLNGSLDQCCAVPTRLWHSLSPHPNAKGCGGYLSSTLFQLLTNKPIQTRAIGVLIWVCCNGWDE